MPGENFFRTAIGASQLVKDGEVMREVLDDDGVVNSVVARRSKTKRAKYRVPWVPNFAVNEEEPAAVGGAKGGPSASVHPIADARSEIERDEDEKGGIIAAGVSKQENVT